MFGQLAFPILQFSIFSDFLHSAFDAHLYVTNLHTPIRILPYLYIFYHNPESCPIELETGFWKFFGQCVEIEANLNQRLRIFKGLILLINSNIDLLH